jgi:hypothetical protein
MQPIEKVLSRLENPKQRRDGQWSARCPAHEDKNPSLSVCETENGSVLAKCFAGCSFERIFACLDLDISEAFPPRNKSGREPRQTPRLITASQALEILNTEANFVAVCGNNLAHGLTLNKADLERLNKSAGRIAYILYETKVKPRKLDWGDNS